MNSWARTLSDKTWLTYSCKTCMSNEHTTNIRVQLCQWVVSMRINYYQFLYFITFSFWMQWAWLFMYCNNLAVSSMWPHCFNRETHRYNAGSTTSQHSWYKSQKQEVDRFWQQITTGTIHTRCFFFLISCTELYTDANRWIILYYTLSTHM